MKNVKFIVAHHFEWIKINLMLMILLNISIWGLFKIVPIFYLIKGIIISTLLVFSYLFAHLSSATPSYTSVGADRFSWKFIQSLPFSKLEIIFAQSLLSILVNLPIVVWILLFGNKVAETMGYTLRIPLFLAAFLLILVLLEIRSITVLIEYPRKEFQKKNSRDLMDLIAGLLIFFATMIGGIALFIFLEIYYVNFFSLIGDKLKTALFSLNSWRLIPVLLILIVLAAKETLKIWVNEKKTYRKPKEKNYQRDLILGVLSLVLIIFSVSQTDFKLSVRYRGAKILSSVFYKDYTGIERELRNGADVNFSNPFGFTPMLIAIFEGDLKMAKFLESKGANYKGEIKISESLKGSNALRLAIYSHNIDTVKYLESRGFSLNQYDTHIKGFPIHAVIGMCDTRMLDYLISRNVDLKALDEEGNNPLMVAAKTKCFPALVMLKEAGVKFEGRDKKGKALADYIKNDKSTISYYIEKNMRSPASK